MSERWVTSEEIFAARDRFEEALGWRRPAAHAIGADLDGTVTWLRINHTGAHLVGAVLATVLGHREGDAVYRMGPAELDAAIALLAPAEACTEMEHPNLALWRRLRAETGDGGSVVVAFVADPAGRSDDPVIASLLAELPA